MCPDIKGWTRLCYPLLILVISFMVPVTFNLQLSHRPLYLFRAVLADAWLGGINMHRAALGYGNLQHANLQHANLQHANLQHANLQHANLQEADLSEANFQGADLSEANFQGADLSEANFQGADLSEATGLTQDQINTACLDADTRLPEGLRRPPPCPTQR
jgi:uncharacterized protein YjbI with pentapeptide repeats